MKKTIVVMVMAAVMAIACCMTCFAGWEQDGAEYKYLDKNGNYVVNRIEAIDGVRYGFDAGGHMIKGWKKLDNNWYYFDKTSGAMATGWLQDGGKWYYMGPNTGNMMTGFVTVGNKKYFLGADGAMVTGQFQDGGYWYKANSDGSIITNKQETLSDGRTIKYDETGAVWYKNAKSRSSDNSEWLPLTSSVQQDFDYDNYGNSVNDILQKYYERYTASIKTKKTAAAKNEYKAEWEARVREELNAIEVEDVVPGLINQYISDVYKTRYKDYTDYFEKHYNGE